MTLWYIAITLAHLGIDTVRVAAGDVWAIPFIPVWIGTYWVWVLFRRVVRQAEARGNIGPPSKIQWFLLVANSAALFLGGL
jgi:hypothetical protein